MCTTGWPLLTIFRQRAAASSEDNIGQREYGQRAMKRRNTLSMQPLEWFSTKEKSHGRVWNRIWNFLIIRQRNFTQPCGRTLFPYSRSKRIWHSPSNLSKLTLYYGIDFYILMNNYTCLLFSYSSSSSCYRQFRLFQPGIKSLNFLFGHTGDILPQVYCPMRLVKISQHPFSLHVRPILFFSFPYTH